MGNVSDPFIMRVAPDSGSSPNFSVSAPFSLAVQQTVDGQPVRLIVANTVVDVFDDCIMIDSPLPVVRNGASD